MLDWTRLTKEDQHLAGSPGTRLMIFFQRWCGVDGQLLVACFVDHWLIWLDCYVVVFIGPASGNCLLKLHSSLFVHI
jgi:hypothetical protein